MSQNIRFSSFQQEAKVANTGGLASEKNKGKTVALNILRPWVAKDGRTRTGKEGNGSLGVDTTEGWLNASQLIAFLGELDPSSATVSALVQKIVITPEVQAVAAVPKVGNTPAKPAVAAVPEVAEYELIIDSSITVSITFDDSGKIVGVEV